jgi:hypothetical protein
MTDKEGTLKIQPYGRWAICRPGRLRVEITSGEVFKIEVPGTDELKPTRRYRQDEIQAQSFVRHGVLLSIAARGLFGLRYRPITFRSAAVVATCRACDSSAGLKFGNRCATATRGRSLGSFYA